MSVTPFSLRGAPALIEHVFPGQKVSAEAYSEQMAGQGKTLTALGSYWKGRKPLVLNRAVLLASLLPVTADPAADLRIFEMLMGMDDAGFARRLPERSPLRAKIATTLYGDLVDAAERAENVPNLLVGVWPKVNAHLGTSARSLPELVEQLGIMRYGRRPRFADTFSGSGQIPFEAARIGFDVYASDLNPVACMLSWGALNVVGAPKGDRAALDAAVASVTKAVQKELDALKVEEDGAGWRAKAYLYCVEVRCPESGWMVPLMPSRVISVRRKVIAELVPDPARKRYDVAVRVGVDAAALEAAKVGTVQKAGRGAESFVVHSPDSVTTFRVPYERIREGRPTTPGGKPPGLRMWERDDVAPRADDILQERLYAVLWQRPVPGTKRVDLAYRAVTAADLQREARVLEVVGANLRAWQEAGFVPSMRIESGRETDRLLRERGWTHWHHLFNPRQLLVLGLLFKHASQSPEYARLAFGLGRALDYGSRLGTWSSGGDKPEHVFYNQALNTFFNYGTRAYSFLTPLLEADFKSFPLVGRSAVNLHPAAELRTEIDIAVTDPPYGDAVNYEEIYDFFISWFRTNPPKQFADWTWDARKALAIKGADQSFKIGMIEAYANLARHMPDDGIQVIMFTHQSGRLWADLASIVWGAGLQVTAAWYVTTEALQRINDGSYVKGTVLLVLRKRSGHEKGFQDDLAFEIEQEVTQQVRDLTGLDQQVRAGAQRSENTFRDADLQMAGYAAALRVLTRYQTIDGRDMVAEARRPRAKGEVTAVDGLIDFAVEIANRALIPIGITQDVWSKASGVERFYLKLLEQESHGVHSLDNVQQFAKAFRVRDAQALLSSAKANRSRLRSSIEFGRSDMNSGHEFAGTPLRGVLFGMWQISQGADKARVIAGLRENVPGYFDARPQVRALAQFLRDTLARFRPEEAEHARLLDLYVLNEGV